MKTAFLEYIKSLVPEENIKFQEPMSEHTTFRVGGEAAVFIEIDSIEALRAIVSYLNITEHPYFILGNGSNLLVGDKGYDGVVLHIGSQFSEVKVQEHVVTAQAGALLGAVARKAAAASLTGMEFASGIPGTIGGAVVMNAGAYDGDISQIVTRVVVMNRQGEVLELDRDTMEFGYRTSILKDRSFIVLEAQFELAEGNQADIKLKTEDFNARRREKQPLEYPSAGSTFKRPEGYFAGKLIMDAGLRGFRIGGAQVSEKHCGFVINVGNASAADISELMDEVSERVKEQFHVTLEPEVIRLGEF